MTRHYRRLALRPIAPALGAEVSGIDLTRLDAGAFAEVVRAFHEHLVLVFRDQPLSAAQLARLGRRFGPLTIGLLVGRGPEHPYVSEVRREANTPASIPNVGGVWHSDQSVRERPGLGFILCARDCPTHGGDTMFANMYAAYAALSPRMQALADQLTVIHCPAGRLGYDGRGLVAYAPGRAIDDATRALLAAEVEHPLVRTHPATGKKLLFINGDYSIRIGGMTEAESRPLLRFFAEHAARPELTCRVRWSPGTVLVADNRACQHFAINDYAGARRHLIRTEIAGDRPYGPAMPRRSRGRAARI